MPFFIGTLPEINVVRAPACTKAAKQYYALQKTHKKTPENRVSDSVEFSSGHAIS
jgi:hypothetical protein